MKMHIKSMDFYTLETRKQVVAYDIGGGWVKNANLLRCMKQN